MPLKKNNQNRSNIGNKEYYLLKQPLGSELPSRVPYAKFNHNKNNRCYILDPNDNDETRHKKELGILKK